MRGNLREGQLSTGNWRGAIVEGQMAEGQMAGGTIGKEGQLHW
jgi:hypothetical protein